MDIGLLEYINGLGLSSYNTTMLTDDSRLMADGDINHYLLKKNSTIYHISIFRMLTDYIVSITDLDEDGNDLTTIDKLVFHHL